MGRAGLRLALAAGLFMSAAGVQSADKLWILTGEVYEDNYYVGLGALIPFPKSTLGNGWVQRYWVDSFTYGYEGATQHIDANVYGAEAMAGYQTSRPGHSGALYLGVRYANTGLNPDDPGNDASGDQLWLKLLAEGEVALGSDWRANGIVSYTLGLNGYWTRARLLRSIGNNLYLGPEAIAQGDPSYNAQKLGLVFGGMRVFPNTFLAVKAGYRFQSDANAYYAGVELVGLF